MPRYAIDVARQPMVATGIVEPIMEWEDLPGGGRKPSDRQAHHELTGMALWGVEVMYPQTVFGRTSTVTAKVSVGAAAEPKPQIYEAVRFEGLQVDARPNKAGGWIEIWRAESIAESRAARGATNSANAA